MAVPSSTRNPVWLPIVVAVLLVLGLAYGERNEASPAPSPVEVRTPSFTVHALSPEQRNAVSPGLKGEVTLGRAYAVASKRYSRVWYVAGQIKGGAADGATALWIVTGSQSEPGLLFSVNRSARTYSVWPGEHASRIQASEVDQEALAATEAIEGR